MEGLKIPGLVLKSEVKTEESTESNEGKVFQEVGPTNPVSLKDQLAIILKQVEEDDELKRNAKLIGKLKGAIELLN